jgi:heptosyltransferase-1
MQLLIIKTSSLGDVIHNLPVMADILAQSPGAEIDWVVEENFADIPAMHPRVRRVIPVGMRRWRRQLIAPATWRDIVRFRRELQDKTYDIVLDSQGLLKSALLARLARGPTRGPDRTTARESLAACFYNQAFHVARGRHAVERNRDLASQALGYPPPVGAPDYGIRAPEITFPFSVPGKFIVGLHATSRASKRWPDEQWITLGKKLAGREIPLLLPWGSPDEERHARNLAQQLEHAIVLPRLNLRELAALMGRAQAVVGVDTGLVHLSAALDRLTVAIFTDTSPRLTGVVASRPERVRNVGDSRQIPDVESVWQALTELKVV